MSDLNSYAEFTAYYELIPGTAKFLDIDIKTVMIRIGFCSDGCSDTYKIFIFDTNDNEICVCDCYDESDIEAFNRGITGETKYITQTHLRIVANAVAASVLSVAAMSGDYTKVSDRIGHRAGILEALSRELFLARESAKLEHDLNHGI